MATRVPAITVQAILEGARRLGLDERSLRVEGNVPDGLDGGVLVPDAMRQRVWSAAYREAQRPEFAVEVGLVLPFGALGPMDYLAASSETLGMSCEALSQQFHTVSCERSLEIEQRSGDYRVKLIVSDARDDTIAGDEFTLGAMVNRFRSRVAGFTIAAVQLKRAAPRYPGRFAELFGAPVSFGHAATALCMPGRLRDEPIASSDPWLRRALESLLSHREMDAHGSGLERSLRSCWRELLPRGRLGAVTVAAALGMSERSLHRRLRELGQSYQVLVDAFRREEAERLLLDGRIDMTSIAHRLGFADQSAFSRAFRRWTHMAPSTWVARKRPLMSATARIDSGCRRQGTVGDGQASNCDSALK
jgi:AraC-like DNA-binding protein